MEKSEKHNVVIQGYPGAFHEIAARRYFRDQEVRIVPSDTFENLVNRVSEDDNGLTGIMAIENTIAGSIMRNYGLINESDLFITGEIYLHITQNLMVLPGTTMEDLREVQSHYMAIAQCKQFFKQYPSIKLVESPDTAESARQISESQKAGVGAIASTLAAEMYGLDIIGPGIETNKLNFTRFVILEKISDSKNSTFDKVSLSFTLPHEVGSLLNVLKTLSRFEANLTKIQSAPIVGKPWEYMFFMDYLLADKRSHLSVITALEEITHGIKILGTYKSGQHYDH